MNVEMIKLEEEIKKTKNDGNEKPARWSYMHNEKLYTKPL